MVQDANPTRRRGKCAVCRTSKFWLVMCILLLSFLYSGVIYGWTGMLLILRSEGVFQEYSQGEQEEKFDFIMTVASFFTAGSGIIIGVFLDKFGPRITSAVSGALTIGGCFVFGLQLELTVGYALFAVGGMGILISSFRAAYLFPEQQSLVIGSISCLFDSSSVVFVIFDLLYQSFGVGLKWLCFGYAGLTVVLQVTVWALWTMNPEYDRLAKVDKEDLRPDPARTVSADRVGDEAAPLLRKREPSAELTMEISRAKPAAAAAALVADLPFSKQIRSPEFGFIYIFCCVLMFRSNVFLGTAGNFLLSLGDAAHHDLYSTFLASIIPLGFIFVPLISYFLDRKGFAYSAYGVVLIGVVYGALSIVPMLEVQLATAFMFTFYRAALFSFVAAFNAKIFGAASVGRVTGILYTSTAVLIVLQYPATAVTVHYFDDNYMPLHALLTGLCALMFIAVAVLQCKSREVGVPEEEEEVDDSGDEGGYAPPGSPALPRSGSRMGLPRSWSMGSEQDIMAAVATPTQSRTGTGGSFRSGAGATRGEHEEYGREMGAPV